MQCVDFTVCSLVPQGDVAQVAGLWQCQPVLCEQR